MADTLMDIKQLAEYLQMNKMTVYKLAREKTIPSFRVASEWRFRKDLIDAWLINQLGEAQGHKKLVAQSQITGAKTILVVDDEQIIRDFFVRTFTDYTVSTVSSGQEALALIKKQRPDLVLLDLKMPGIDGIETLKKIKEFDSSIAVIMLSAFGSLQTSLEAARLGAFSSMAKPFDLHEMTPIINEALVSGVSAAPKPQQPSFQKAKRKSRRT